MDRLALTDWVTIRCDGTVQTSVTQAESAWLDLWNYNDIVIWLLCSEVTGGATVSLAFETAPTKDNTFFKAMATISPLTAQSVPVVTPILLSVAATPLARYVRWKLSGPASVFDATFRAVVAAYSPNGRLVALGDPTAPPIPPPPSPPPYMGGLVATNSGGSNVGITGINSNLRLSPQPQPSFVAVPPKNQNIP